MQEYAPAGPAAAAEPAALTLPAHGFSHCAAQAPQAKGRNTLLHHLHHMRPPLHHMRPAPHPPPQNAPPSAPPAPAPPRGASHGS
ncbi:hypothetical protein CLOM_g10890 [Closterium sp. NIES-68]|nr:hypothetical protein CLOM_g10890 [Closterium sp. NIES-68]GJP74854.1 hypothetical protein CLOP_g5383 [Closterium sp. NIES-67]